MSRDGALRAFALPCFQNVYANNPLCGPFRSLLPLYLSCDSQRQDRLYERSRTERLLISAFTAASRAAEAANRNIQQANNEVNFLTNKLLPDF